LIIQVSNSFKQQNLELQKRLDEIKNGFQIKNHTIAPQRPGNYTINQFNIHRPITFPNRPQTINQIPRPMQQRFPPNTLGLRPQFPINRFNPPHNIRNHFGSFPH
jgi:hypothetical protein